MRYVLPLALAVLSAAPGQAQLKRASVPIPVTPSDPTTPPARNFNDPRSGLSFKVPAGWALTRKDHEVSTFALDARSVSKTTQLRAVASITFNPFPLSTFSGAYFYASSTPKLNDADCARQASLKMEHPATVTVGGTPYTHGYDEHGGVCIESRDEIYTVERSGSCYRFDLVINNFCGGDVSGVRDITPKELESVRGRLVGILSSVQFDNPK